MNEVKTYLDLGYDANMVRLPLGMSFVTAAEMDAFNELAASSIRTQKLRDESVTDEKIESLTVGKLIAGEITSKDIELISDGSGDSVIRAGKTDFTNTETGFILGIDDSDGDKPKFFIGSPTKYINWDGASMIIRGTLNADDIVAGTIQGRTLIANGGIGNDVQISNIGLIEFKYGGSTQAQIYASSSGQMLIDGNDFYCASDKKLVFVFNDDGGSDKVSFISDNTVVSQLDKNGNWVSDGTYT